MMNNESSQITIVHGHTFHIVHEKSSGAQIHLESNSGYGFVYNEMGTILANGPVDLLKSDFPGAKILDFKDAFIFPGFIDAHVHFPQIAMIASWGEGLMSWLERYTFPEEKKYVNQDYSRLWARRFVHQLLAAGTTTAAIYSSNHRSSTDILFEEIERQGIRAIAGKTSMDRNAPAELLVSAEEDLDDHLMLIEKWHRKTEFCNYAITPRFAISCSDKLLTSLGTLAARFPDLYIQTHFSETLDEIETVRALFPKQRDYLSVYSEYGLLGSKTLLGHCIHPSDAELELIKNCGATIVHCPTSNNFLGSGHCQVKKLFSEGFPIALGSDVGAGTSLSMFQSMRDAYCIQKQIQQTLQPKELLHFATLGAAESLSLTNLGNFEPGKQADFMVINWRKNPLLKERLENTSTDEERLFATMILGDERLVERTFVAGKQVSVS